MTTLRERNRRAALEHVQRVAMGLFEQRGYAAVTIADIAREAGVSESTYYRLFATKEGLFTAPPWEGGPHLTGSSVAELYDEVRRLVDGYEWLGLRWAIDEPDVRRAVLSSLDGLAGHGAEHLVAHGHDPLDAAVAARELLFGVYFTALEQWYRSGRRGTFVEAFDRARHAARR